MWRWLYSLFTWIVLVVAVPACGEADDGRTDYGLKVVVEPRGKPAFAACVPLGNPTPVTLGHALPDDLWLETRAHTLHGATFYDVRLLRSGARSVLGGFRHDERMAREKDDLRTFVQDAQGEYVVRVSGTFDRDEPCVP